MQRRTSTILTVLVLILFTTLLSMGWVFWQQRTLNASGSDVAVNITQESLRTLSASAMLDIAHPQLLSEMTAEDLRDYLILVSSRLGALQTMVDIRGGITTTPLPVPGRAIDASFEIGLEFAASSAVAEIDLQHIEGQWKLVRFRIAAQRLFS